METETGSSATARPSSPRWRKWLLALVVIVGLAAVLSLPVVHRVYGGLAIRTCLQNAEDLRVGAQVRIGGVTVGHVKSVRARPDNPDCPADVEIMLNPGYELRIPADSVVVVETAGLFGDAFLTIDSTRASGRPIENDGTLKSQPSEELSKAKLLELFKRLGESPCGEKPEPGTGKPKK